MKDFDAEYLNVYSSTNESTLPLISLSLTLVYDIRFKAF